jgi:hypothetical protein
MNGCRLLTPISKGDKIWLAANYNLTKYSGSVFFHLVQATQLTFSRSTMENGELDEVMGVGTMTIIT